MLNSTFSVRQPGPSFNGKTVHQHFKSKKQTVLKQATIMKRMNMIICADYMFEFQLRKSVVQSQAMMFLESFDLYQVIHLSLISVKHHARTRRLPVLEFILSSFQ